MKSHSRLLLASILLIGCAIAQPTLAAETDSKVWITLDQHTFELLQTIDPAIQSHDSQALTNGLIINGQAAHDQIHIVAVNENLLDDLSRQVHRVENHCAGYVRHASLADAQAALQSQQSLIAFSRPTYEITHQALVSPMLDQMAASNIADTILSLADFQNRYYDSNYGAQSSDWLAGKWSALANGRADIHVEQVSYGNYAQSSVIVTIEGNELASQVLVMGAHLDSINHSDRRGPHETSLAPGADDDASGVASLTEVLRVLAANNYQPQRTIKLMAYAAEEVGLVGSGYIAQDFANRGVDVVGVLQLDMTNYKGSAGDIYLISDYTDSQQNQFVEDVVNTYLPQLSVSYQQCGYACSDHASWTQQGYAASFPFEAAMYDANPYIHSSQDTFANSGGQATHALKFSRLALAYIVELGDIAGGGGDDDDGSDNVLENGVPVTGLSGNQGSEVIYSLDVPSDASDLLFTINGGSGDADLYVQYGSAPTTSSYDCRPYIGGNNEDCSFASPQAGTWYVMLRAYSSYSGVTLEGSYSTGTPDPDPNPGACPTGYEEYTGSLSIGGSAYEPDGTYYYSGSGSHNGVLSGPAGTDFDLYLQKWNGYGWNDVAQSISSDSEEAINYSGGSGYYSFRLEAYSGSGDYTFCLDKP